MADAPQCDLFGEKASGGRWDWPELQRLLGHLRANRRINNPAVGLLRAPSVLL